MSTPTISRGTAAAWAACNPVLPAGAMGIETDTLIVRIGDGVTAAASMAGFTTGLSVAQNWALANVSGYSSSSTSGPKVGTFVFSQLAPATVWTIQHNMGRYPDVTVTDPTGANVEGDVDYIDSNNLTITFSLPFAGTAYLN